MNPASIKKLPDKTSGAPGNRRRYLVLAGLLILLLACVRGFRPDSQLEQVRQMQRELFDMPSGQLSPEERKQKFEALRAVQEKLTPEQRTSLRKETGMLFQKKMNARAVKYLAMSPLERRKVIDDQIVREKAAQKKGPGTNGPRGPKGTGAPGTAKAAPGGGSPRTSSTPEERDSKRRESLLHTSPLARAGMDQMRLDLATRRVQLGLPPSTSRSGR